MDLFEKLKRQRQLQMQGKDPEALLDQATPNPYENFDSAYGDGEEELEAIEPDNSRLLEQALLEKEDLRKGYLIPNKRTPKKDVPQVWEKIRQMFKRQ